MTTITTTHAACCLVSTKPGVANVTNFTGRFDQTVKCAHCSAEYRIDYTPSELGRIENYESRLRAEAQQKVNADHPFGAALFVGHRPHISIYGLSS
jgi:hypothetical protein